MVCSSLCTEENPSLTPTLPATPLFPGVAMLSFWAPGPAWMGSAGIICCHSNGEECVFVPIREVGVP